MTEATINHAADSIIEHVRGTNARVVSIFGPTGSGKTDVAVRVAAALGTRVVNADPAQCYDGLPILTNKPTEEHDAIARHELVGIWSLSTYATVASFATAAHESVDRLVERNNCAVIAGGSGMYMLAALSELSFGDHESGDRGEHRRTELERHYDEAGFDAAYAELRRRDPHAARSVHPNDRKRVIRALDVAMSGSSIASGSIWDAPARHATASFGLALERSVMHDRINSRTHTMFSAGVLHEVSAVTGPTGDDLSLLSETSVKLHGLSDCIDILAGRITQEVGMQQMATRTRQYAKRQDTWARRWPGLVPITCSPER